MKIQVNRIKKLLLLLAAVTCIAAFGFNLYYLLNSHQSLLSAYFQLNSCFYKSEFFEAAFFNEHTKAQGNLFSLLSIFICIATLVTLLKKWKLLPGAPKETLAISVPSATRPYLLILFVFSLAAWMYGYLTITPGYDEVFSAQQCAELPWFQTWSYYMIPNNHIGYNLLNKLLFFWVDNKVISGKIISLLAYLSWNTIAFFAFCRFTASRTISLAASIVMALQFPVWGFGFEARGYELYGVCEFISFLSLIAWLKNKEAHWLLLNVLVSILGYAVLPTFMYLHFAQIIFGLWACWGSKKCLINFYRYQFYILAGVFFFYLPALCYSGLGAFIDNKYTRAVDLSYLDFTVKLFKTLPSYFDYTARGFSIIKTILVIVLSIVPFALLLNKQFNSLSFSFLFKSD